MKLSHITGKGNRIVCPLIIFHQLIKIYSLKTSYMYAVCFDDKHPLFSYSMSPRGPHQVSFSTSLHHIF